VKVFVDGTVVTGDGVEPLLQATVVRTSTSATSVRFFMTPFPSLVRQALATLVTSNKSVAEGQRPT